MWFSQEGKGKHDGYSSVSASLVAQFSSMTHREVGGAGEGTKEKFSDEGVFFIIF